MVSHHVLYCSLGSQCVPQGCSLRVFPIAPQFNPTCFT
jgi:hypothetical protein